jgi:LAS superfamily LD-carboxypeptidase LdcB
VDTKIPDVKIPENFNPALPANFHAVPIGQMPELMQNLTLFTNSSQCKMLIYANPSIVNLGEANGKISMRPIANTGNESMQNAGVLIALSTDKNNQKIEMLHINLNKSGSDWLISTVKNEAMGNIPVKSQLRIISPRFILTKEQTNDTSKLKTFDPSPFGPSEKAPFRMRPECIDPMMQMLNKAKSEGMTSITIRDTYRGYAIQNTYFQNKVNYHMQNGLTLAQAKLKTEQLIAFPGTSEHHGGYTADITVINAGLEQEFSKTTFGIWLSKNCWNYGYIIRYLSGKEVQTTKGFEPWHIRYVGIPASLIIRKYGIVLDEFQAYLKDRQYIASTYDANPESGSSTQTDSIFARFNTISDCKIPSDIAKSASTVFSDVGDGSYVLFCNF